VGRADGERETGSRCSEVVFNSIFRPIYWTKEEDKMKENSDVNLSREAAEMVLDFLNRAEMLYDDKRRDSLLDMIGAALESPQQPTLETAKEAARARLAQAIENLAQAQGAFAECLAHGTENGQRSAAAAIGVSETMLQSSQAAYDAAAADVLEATAESAEKNRRVAYAKSEKAHNETLAALRTFEPMAQELSKLFRILSFHADLALADTEAADKARISPHAANAANFLRKILEQQKLGNSEAVTKHALAALHELELSQGQI
jgi:hypothetical protein